MTIPDPKKIKPHLPQTLKSSAAYSLGMGLVGILITGLFAGADLAHFSDMMQAELLFIGVLIAVFIAAIGSGVGGAIGAVTLPLPPDIAKSNWSKVWRGGLSMGLLFGLLMVGKRGVWHVALASMIGFCIGGF